ncbi:HAD family hydrolase [Sphingobacterium psychroaquaticum]|uniref:HAD family hydrolase n=1 Tax=Sphingobacterium psychroaquaticum TaxID=561061 RepID=UPI00106C93B4|nr:HAD family hydrolase [Sphingobacterium psychroaquaticum]QBQ39928.1 HAD family hydrolase [Sphingobacterium psychroaquaticum]
MSKIKLAVFDMAGTTVRDEREVEKCFFEAIQATNLSISTEKINSMMGWSKILVFETIWREELGEDHPEYSAKVKASYDFFCNTLEAHYNTHGAQPYDGVLDVFEFCRSQGIKIALTTGFYRKVTDIILAKLGWDKGLDGTYMSLINTPENIINCSIASSDVKNGRPAPEMIQLAMAKCLIDDPKSVINLGDTPSDLQSAASAGVLYSVGSLYGTHTEAELASYKFDQLINQPKEMIEIIRRLND